MPLNDLALRVLNLIEKNNASPFIFLNAKKTNHICNNTMRYFLMKNLPDYFKDHIIYYAGPAKTPEGKASGSFGPTTAGRMDSYVTQFQAAGGSMIMLAKGNRSQTVVDACKQYGGFYLGSIGGPAALLAEENIKSVKVLEYPELGMEAVWEIDVVDFPAYILIDDKGNDFFASVADSCSKCSINAYESAKK